MLNVGKNYQGYKIIGTDNPMLSKIYEDETANPFQLVENQYLIITREDGTIADSRKWQDGVLKTFKVKPIISDLHGKIKPKNIQQVCLMDMLADQTTTVKVISGSYGSGKTFLGLLESFQAMQKDGLFDRLVWIRNNVEVKDSNPIGYLKGQYLDKMIVWAGPLMDFLGGYEELQKYVEQELIQIEHLGFLRGRSFKNSIIYCTEAEHLTREHIQLLLGRVAEGSILILEGDCRQIDAKAFEKDNGMEAIIHCLKGNRLFGYVHLNESVRSETAKLADLLDSYKEE